MSQEERRAARRADLLEAGIDIAGTRGFGQMKIRDVCLHTGLSERYFYESFSGLDEFSTAVVREVFTSSAVRVVAKALKETEPDAQARALFAEIAKLAAETPERGRVLLVETLRAGGDLEEMRAAVLATAAMMTRALLEAPPGFDLSDYVNPLVTAMLAGRELPNVKDAYADPTSVAAAGAITEVLVAWLNGRLNLTGPALGEFLYEFATTAFQHAARAAD